eukprot:620174-Hanusia_phi.AAC.1
MSAQQQPHGLAASKGPAQETGRGGRRGCAAADSSAGMWSRGSIPSQHAREPAAGAGGSQGAGAASAMGKQGNRQADVKSRNDIQTCFNACSANSHSLHLTPSGHGRDILLSVIPQRVRSPAASSRRSCSSGANVSLRLQEVVGQRLELWLAFLSVLMARSGVELDDALVQVFCTTNQPPSSPAQMNVTIKLHDRGLVSASIAVVRRREERQHAARVLHKTSRWENSDRSRSTCH